MSDALQYSRGFAWLARLPRALLRWIATAAVLWHMLATDVLHQLLGIGTPSDTITRATVFGFAATIYGIRAVETTAKGKSV